MIATWYLHVDNVTVAFTNSTFRVNESDGFVQVSVELNKAIVCCPISILIECENDSATGKHFIYAYVITMFTW